MLDRTSALATTIQTFMFAKVDCFEPSPNSCPSSIPRASPVPRPRTRFQSATKCNVYVEGFEGLVCKAELNDPEE